MVSSSDEQRNRRVVSCVASSANDQLLLATSGGGLYSLLFQDVDDSPPDLHPLAECLAELSSTRNPRVFLRCFFWRVYSRRTRLCSTTVETRALDIEPLSTRGRVWKLGRHKTRSRERARESERERDRHALLTFSAGLFVFECVCS